MVACVVGAPDKRCCASVGDEQRVEVAEETLVTMIYVVKFPFHERL